MILKFLLIDYLLHHVNCKISTINYFNRWISFDEVINSGFVYIEGDKLRSIDCYFNIYTDYDEIGINGTCLIIYGKEHENYLYMLSTYKVKLSEIKIDK